MSLLEQVRFKVLPALATPLLPNGYHVDVEAIAPLVEFLLARGVGGLFVGGTTGEGMLLSAAERKKLHEEAVEAVAGRVPVIVHVGTDTTRHSFDLAVHAEAIDADAIAVITPTYYPLDDDTLFDYFATIAAAAPDTPMLVYDIPHMAINGISPQLLTRLSAIPTFAGMKCSRHDAQIIRQLMHTMPSDKVFLVGNERILLGTMAMGAHGAISGLSTAFPEPFVAMLSAIEQGNWDEARNWHRLISKILDALAHANRIGTVKAILNARGVAMGTPVPPRPVVAPSIWQTVVDCLE